MRAFNATRLGRASLARALVAVTATCQASLAAPVSPSQVTSPSYQPAPLATAPRFQPAKAPGPRPPAGSETLITNIGQVEIEGGFPELAQAGRAATQDLEGRRVNVAAIFAAASALEQAYAAAGFIFARVVVPPQKLVDGGALKLRVIDGFVEAIDLGGVPDAARAVVRARVAKLLGRRHLKLADIERALLIAGDAPGLVLQSAIARGDTPEGTKLVLQGTQKLISTTASVDNRLPRSLGGWQSSATISLNDVLAAGEQFYATLGSGLPLDTTAPDGGRIFLFSLGGSAPIGADGFALSPEYTHSQTRPEAAAGAPPTQGVMDRVTLRAGYDLIRTRAETVRTEISLGYLQQRNAALGFGTQIDRDAYGFLRGSLVWRGATSGAVAWQARLEGSQGLGGRDGAQAAASGVPISRQGASPYFHKLDLSGQWSQPLPEGSRLDVSAKAQYTFGAPVFVSEQMALDGADAVSAVPDGTFSVDEGIAARGELARPFNAAASPAPQVWTPYLFAAVGIGRLMRPTAQEIVQPIAGAFGVGARMQIDLGEGRTATAGAELGRELSNEPALAAGYRIGLNFALQF